ncbi:MAG: hypothetical protein MZV70_37040, partial [Desulfobacterales bacterium]|nr:hypothetical protein [Desulfobacterales bacterium]
KLRIAKVKQTTTNGIDSTLNARIKAAHLGTEGAALDTISGSIYELSRQRPGGHEFSDRSAGKPGGPLRELQGRLESHAGEADPDRGSHGGQAERAHRIFARHQSHRALHAQRG